MKGTSGIVAIGVFGLLGIGLVSYGGYHMLQARAAASWPTVDGRVVETVVETVYKGNQPTAYYEPTVTYAYSVDGAEHESDRWSFSGVGDLAQAEANAFKVRFPPGRTVTVHYDPGQPATSVLKIDGGGSNWAFLALGALPLALAVVIFLARRAG